MQYNIYQVPEKSSLTTSFIGKNARNILIVLKNPGYTDHSGLLEKIMRSVGLQLSDDCLVYPVSEASYTTLSEIRKIHQVDQMIMFGDLLPQLGMQIRARKNIPFPFSGCQVLVTYPLGELPADQKKKRILWNALKEMFQS